MRALLYLLLTLLLPLSAAAEALDTTEFATLPVLHEGRIKPLDSFARLQFGQDKPVEKLVEALFAPEKVGAEPLFTLPLPALQTTLSLPPKDHYSYEELAPALDVLRPTLNELAAKDKNKLSAHEKALWQLYQQVDALAQIMRSLTGLMPLHIDGEASPTTYLAMRDKQEGITNELKAIIKKKGEKITQYTAKEKQIAATSFLLASIRAMGMGNELFKVLPTGDGEEMIAPWEVIDGGKGTPQSGAAMALWQKLIAAYIAQDAKTWQQTVSEIKQQSLSALPVPEWKLTLEIGLNQLSLIPKISALYALGLALLLLAATRRFAPPVIGVALFLHALLILSRIILLGRPPVSTLYESILFVGLIAAAYGYWLYQRRQLLEAMAIGAFLGGGLLAVSGIYAGQGDNMGMLIAVLNTNFWLATHVVCITLGYATTLVAGSMAHLALLPKYHASRFSRMLPFVTVIALLFTAIGTILGGVWADQSWGRFWGWDPKENGALWIVLWLVWLLHGRMTRYVGERGFMAWLAASNMIVALSWFGVNLLGTGLHSYGFTDAAAYGLFWFCAAEVILIIALYLYPLLWQGKSHKTVA